MDLASGALLAAMGILAGIINAAVGSGSLLTLPVLIALGLPPGEAVRTNTMGMVFSTVGSAAGFRREIAAERGNLGPLSLVTILAAATGAVLLLLSPSSALDIVVPVLIVLALVLVVAQPRLVAWAAARRESAGTGAPALGSDVGPVGAAYRRPGVIVPMGLAGMYGGYFTAAQGVLYMGILGVGTGRSMKAVNPVKNLLSLYVNLTAAAVYLGAHLALGASVAWWGVAVLAVSGLVGGWIGSRVAKRLPNGALRALIVVVALVALVRQFV